MARVPLIQEQSDLPEQHNELFQELASLRGRISGPSSVVLHSPGLARPWNAISEFLHRQSVVEPEFAELAVCATARHFDCGYIWAAHAPAARRAGISEDTIAGLATNRDDITLAPQAGDVLRYARQLLRANRIESEIFNPLLEAHGPRWLVELTAWIGRYGALAGILNCFEVSAPPERDVLPSLSSGNPTSVHPARPPLGTPRVTPITARNQVQESDAAVFDAVSAGRGNVRGPFSLLLYSPPLCERILELSDYLRQDCFLPASARELAVIATAKEQDCPYVWAAHAPAARKAGVPDSLVSAVRTGDPPAGGSPAETGIVELVSQLMTAHSVEQGLFDRLLAEHSLPGLVELTAVVGHYFFVTTLLNAFEVAPGPGAESLPLG
jgi:4-carboxymuconolactone decarboxylase